MAENISVTCADGCAKIVLSGRLDATSAPVHTNSVENIDAVANQV